MKKLLEKIKEEEFKKMSMDFEIIETERLTLRGFSPENLKTIFEQFPKSEIREILQLRTEAEFLKEEKKFINGFRSHNISFRLFLLIDKASGKVIGRGGLHNWHTEHNRAELGYVMEDEAYKRKGLMSEAVGAFIDYGFTKLNLNRIEAFIEPGNIPSLKIIEKYNFTKEGLLKQHYKVKDKFENSLLFCLLSENYKK